MRDLDCAPVAARSKAKMTSHTDYELEAVRLGLPLFLNSKDAARMMSVGPTKLRELISAGEIEGRKRGKDLVVKTASILRFNANLPPAKFSPHKSKAA